MDKALYEFGRKAADIIPKFVREILKKQAKAFAKSDVTIPQMIILNFLKEKGCSKMNETAKLLSISTSAATGIVERMVKAGFVKRGADENDRRIIKIEATAKGLKAIEVIEKTRNKMMMELFGKLPARDRDTYLKTVKKLYRIMTEDAG